MESITDGFNEIKDAHLGLTGCGIGKSPHFKHIRVLKKLCGNPPATDGAVLADALLARIEHNWRAGRDEHETAPSRENWRFRKAGNMASYNPSPEVTFERDFIEVAGDDWANQVPTSSGLLGPWADKRRAIDLVECKGEGVFEFIELKIESDTPLIAALEVLDYAALYAFTRLNADELGYGPGFSELLEAQHIKLRVLAPQPFYGFKTRGDRRPYQLEWLEQALHTATSRLSKRIGREFQMDFRFEIFPDEFAWGPEHRRCRSHILKMMAGRRPLISRSDDR